MNRNIIELTILGENTSNQTLTDATEAAGMDTFFHYTGEAAPIESGSGGLFRHVSQLLEVVAHHHQSRHTLAHGAGELLGASPAHVPGGEHP